MTAEHPLDDNDRSVHLEAVLDEMLVKIMINLNQRGYGTAEILAALDNVCDKRHQALEEDPDPAGDAPTSPN